MPSTDEILASAAALGPAAYFQAVMEQTRPLHDRFNSQNELTATLAARDIRKLRSLLSVSLVLNDRTAVHYIGPGDLKVSIPPPEKYKQMFGVDQVLFNITSEHVKQYKIDPLQPSLSPCFTYSEGHELAPLLKALLPCIEKGRVAFQPIRGILTKQDRSAGGGSDWQIIGTDTKAKLDLWEPGQSDPRGKPVPLAMSDSSPMGKTLFEITMPFLKGVPFRELDALLTNEADIVASFRASLKLAVREAATVNASSAEIIGDVVKPRLDLLEKKMKSLHRIHRLKLGGAALGSVALAFTSASTGAVGAGLLAVASAGGFGLLANQYSDYLEKRDELHQDPFYFLWRCKQVANSAKKF